MLSFVGCVLCSRCAVYTAEFCVFRIHKYSLTLLTPHSLIIIIKIHSHDTYAYLILIRNALAKMNPASGSGRFSLFLLLYSYVMCNL